ncbi:uncharacterized protein HMPREF1541_00327 [Cyphellophora europaea CBS 101466]|uniref:Uncharacterized protein n=1 Tax=Cyphellophora europaea (strain CBS 101466) TaxID=1220924 RepID=W2SDM8_CYPE1|nr:uncharacterized protein HMPREF1541_00327 [Cyphellophora europaea CBS 101466]ETN46143.1 hypothetical protein HMPREF1541_00327 [Cyphellophora europaea CBS 101466]
MVNPQPVSSESHTESHTHESKSTFVPLFLSNRSITEQAHPLEAEFEYLGPAQRTGTDLSVLSEASAMPQAQRTLFGEHQPSHSDVSSSLSSSTKTTKPRSKATHSKAKTRQSPSRTASSRTVSSSRTKSSSRPRRKVSYTVRLRVAVESKLRLTIAFGFGSFASLIIYIALLVTHTSSGIAFHALSILLLISLLGVTIHSLVRFLALNSELKAHRQHRAGLKKTPSARGWNISRPLPQFIQSSTLNEKSEYIGQAHGGHENDEFPVFGGANNYGTDYNHNPFGDEHDIEAQPAMMERLAHPPPVYGNTRTSVRLSINPASPTYAQHPGVHPDPNITAPAPTLAPGMVGWHPASFRSEGGITAVLERRRREVEERLGGGGEVLGNRRYEPQPAGGMI